MRKFFVSLSGLVGVGLVSSAYAEEFTLGGTIDLGAEYGIGKDYGSGFAYKKAYADFDFNLSIADTTDSGLRFGATLNLAGRTSLAFEPYVSTNLSGEVVHWVFRITGQDYTDIRGNAYNVSGGQRITEDQIVAIKVNSDWVSVGGTHTEYDEEIDVDWDEYRDQHKADICKLAGRIPTNALWSTASVIVGRPNANGTVPLVTGAFPAAVPVSGGIPVASASVGYWPAGLLLNPNIINSNTLFSLSTGLGFNGSNPNVLGHGDSTASLLSIVTGPASTTIANPGRVYVGPFASVKVQSSTTKLVTGLVCAVQTENSDTKYYQRPIDSVIQATDATVFIEGGFGRLTLQTEDYDGAVEAVGAAGDQIKLDSSGVIAILQTNLGGYGSAYAAMDLLGPVNYDMALIAGVEIDLSPFAVAFESQHTDSEKWFETWDAEISFGSDDFEVGVVTDSTSAFGFYGGLEWLGFEMDGELVYSGNEPHKKSGFSGEVSATTTINNVTLGGAVDESFNPSFDASWLLQGTRYSLELYGTYAAVDNGGKVGVKVAF